MRLRGVDLAKHPHDPPARLGIHRQHVDDVGPVVASLVAIAEQLRGDLIAVGLVADQDAAEAVAAFGLSVRIRARSSASSSSTCFSRIRRDRLLNSQ